MRAKTETNDSRLKAASKSSLPEAVNLLDKEVFSDVWYRLQRAQELRTEIDERQEELEEIKTGLILACRAYGLEKGLRAGKCGFEFHADQTRKTINKELLLENGVTVDQIEASMKDSTPFDVCKFIDFDIL